MLGAGTWLPDYRFRAKFDRILSIDDLSFQRPSWTIPVVLLVLKNVVTFCHNLQHIRCFPRRKLHKIYKWPSYVARGATLCDLIASDTQASRNPKSLFVSPAIDQGGTHVPGFRLPAFDRLPQLITNEHLDQNVGRYSDIFDRRRISPYTE